MAAYIRTESAVPAGADDPGFLQPDVQSELIRRARHDGDVFAHNNRQIWMMVYHVTHGTEAWSIVRTHNRTANGRQAYLDLVSHYRGEGHQNRIRSDAERTLSKLFWNGKKNFEFSTFTARMTGAFSDLENTGDGRSDRHKVTFLLSKIQEDSGLNAACTHVRGDATLSQDFRGAIEYLTNEANDVATRRATARAQRNISAMGTGRGHGGGNGAGRGGGRGGRGGRHGRGGGRGRGNGGRQTFPGERWSEDGETLLHNGGYSPERWQSLSRNDRAEVICMRQREDSRRQREREVAAAGRDQGSGGGDGLPPPPQGHPRPQQDFSMMRQRQQS